MALLADGINLPIVAIAGLIVFAPLTLLVTLIECFTFRVVLRAPFRIVFGRVLIANIASTLAGAVVLGFQDYVVEWSGIQGSIPAFVSGFQWVGLLLIVIYFVKSVLVEAIVLATGGFVARLRRTHAGVLAAVVVGNTASYCVVGPLFYYSARPTFGGVEITTGTDWTANGAELAYYIDQGSRFVKRVRLDGSEPNTVVPYPVKAFQVCAGGKVFVYRGADGDLYVYRLGDAEPILARKTEECFFMPSVSLSPDTHRLVYTEGHKQAETDRQYYIVKIIELDSGAVAQVPEFWVFRWTAPSVSWSADGSVIYVEQDKEAIGVVSGEAPHAVTALPIGNAPPPEQLVENYLRAAGCYQYSGSNWGVYWETDETGEYRVTAYPYLGSFLRVARAGEAQLVIRNEYGLLNLSRRPPEYPSFLPKGLEVLVEWWGQLYILDVQHRRLGLLTNGEHYVLRMPRFRVRFGPQGDS